MKRIIFTGIIAIISLFAFSSCSTLGKTCASAPFAYTEVHPNEIRADLNFNTSEKLEGTVRVGYLFGIKVSGGRKYAEVLTTNNSKSILVCVASAFVRWPWRKRWKERIVIWS